MKKNICPQCGCKKLASAPGGTHLTKTNSKVTVICTKCLYEF